MTQAYSPTAILRNGLLRILIPLSFALTVYLYLFPIFSACAFPLPPQVDAAEKTSTAFRETIKLHLPPPPQPTESNGTDSSSTTPFETTPLAPFRLLTLGDPQLEGDTSIPTDYLGVFPHAKSLWQHVSFQSSHSSLRHRVKQALHDLVDVCLEDTFNLAESVRKRIDLFGNDYYLAHIYRTVHWWTKPTHVTVLGDLVGSQWLNEQEFARRADRFWTRVFRGGEKVPDEVAAYPAEEYDLSGYLGYGRNESDGIWSRRLINVAGNHDIGYAGDINTDLTERFEKAFGKVNYELRFELPLPNGTDLKSLYDPDTNPGATNLVPELRLVVLNDMNLDTPALSPQLQDDTYTFINNIINTAAAVEFQGHYTIVLTHIPLAKPAGVCVDSPFFDFHGHDGSLKEQNQLSVDASKGFLEGILGMSASPTAAGGGKGRRGIILNGHDHEGCDTYHFINQTSEEEEKNWEVKRWRQATREGVVGREGAPGVREITVRSMMGDFGGNAGLLSVWFDEANWEWKAEYATCPLGTQHLWWLVHILDLISVMGLVLLVLVTVLNAVGVDVDGIITRRPKAKTQPNTRVQETKEINGVEQTLAKEVITINGGKEKILDKAQEVSVF